VQLRGYQRRLVAAARSGGNFIFVAPTNSGKTAVALEHAAHVLGKDSSARVVFVAPTVALATQQAGEWRVTAGLVCTGWKTQWVESVHETHTCCDLSNASYAFKVD